MSRIVNPDIDRSIIKIHACRCISSISRIIPYEPHRLARARVDLVRFYSSHPGPDRPLESAPRTAQFGFRHTALSAEAAIFQRSLHTGAESPWPNPKLDSLIKYARTLVNNITGYSTVQRYADEVARKDLELEKANADSKRIKDKYDDIIERRRMSQREINALLQVQ